MKEPPQQRRRRSDRTSAEQHNPRDTVETELGGSLLRRQRLPRPPLIRLSSPLHSLLSRSLCKNFSPDAETLNHVICRFSGLSALTVDCIRLVDASVNNLLGPHLRELNLLKCCSLSYHVLASVGHNCRIHLIAMVLMLELVGLNSPALFQGKLVELLEGCLYLESLSIKIRGTEHDLNFFQFLAPFLPKTIKALKLRPMFKNDAILFIYEVRDRSYFLETSTKLGTPFSPGSPILGLQCLSLVIDIISDDLIISIVSSLPLLAELDLEDSPSIGPSISYDLTKSDLQCLGSCQYLTSLSLMRSRQNHQVSFKRVNDLGMFLLSEGCKGLESVRIGGFSKVTDAGFAAILHSCQKLRKFEVRNASLLSDLAFLDITRAPCPLVEVRLLSCSLITSDTGGQLASSSTLEVLDLGGCKSIADASLSSISCLNMLTSLNLGGADVTNSGLALLGRGSSPIARLSLRGCKRASDKGVALLLRGEGAISKTLSSLDIGYMPGISDRAVRTISKVAHAVIELCIRQCYFVTDASLKTLASERLQDGTKELRKLDVYNCTGFSVESLGLLKKPAFRGLQWIGYGGTRWASKGDFVSTTFARKGRG
ncbi:hypothetical protein RJ639_008341 [Escallonia herrerae]|uniref:F-box/LRR-repeat protein 15-like leucin rich repeat domain-containing protein n=1 Tax=Escallonia herrerae TaxID=1293975 RepID=A0AA89AT31_9ASTE|nr:hypothetical protein RJ639_008341 [Escallonia herrerae]